MSEIELTDAELARLEELRAKATPGEWEQVFPYSVGVGEPDAPDSTFIASTLVRGAEEADERRDNAAYIAASCNAVPLLVAEVRRSRGALSNEHRAWQCADARGDGLEIENAALRERVEALDRLNNAKRCEGMDRVKHG